MSGFIFGILYVVLLGLAVTIGFGMGRDSTAIDCNRLGAFARGSTVFTCAVKS